MKNKLSQSSNAIHEVTSNPASKPFINSSPMLYVVYISYRVYTIENEAERHEKDCPASKQNSEQNAVK